MSMQINISLDTVEPKNTLDWQDIFVIVPDAFWSFGLLPTINIFNMLHMKCRSHSTWRTLTDSLGSARSAVCLYSWDSFLSPSLNGWVFLRLPSYLIHRNADKTINAIFRSKKTGFCTKRLLQFDEWWTFSQVYILYIRFDSNLQPNSRNIRGVIMKAVITSFALFQRQIQGFKVTSFAMIILTTFWFLWFLFMCRIAPRTPALEGSLEWHFRCLWKSRTWKPSMAFNRALLPQLWYRKSLLDCM